MNNLNKDILEVLVGLLLSDAYIGKTGNRYFITFEQSSKHEDYVIFIYNLLKKQEIGLFDIKYYTRLDKRYNTKSKSVYFKTHNTDVFHLLAIMFLKNGTKKVVRFSIKYWLTPISLAHWICGDGQHVKDGGITLCTDSYDLQEVNLLIKALTLNFHVRCSIHKKKGVKGKFYHRIYIFKDSLDKIKPLLVKHMHPSFLYKLHM